MNNVEVWSGRRELETLAPQWEALAACALEPNPAYEPWMLLPALQAYGAGQEVVVAAVRRGAELIGLFPLQRVPRLRGLPLAALTSWRHPHCMLCVPLVHAQHAREALRALFGWAARRASLVELSHLPADGAFHQALVDALDEQGRALVLTDAYTRALLRRGADAARYIETAVEREQRKDLLRRERRLAEQGRIEHKVLERAQDLTQWIEEFLALEASGWKGERGSALGCSEAGRRFARALFTAAFARGRLIMVGIDFEGQPIARYCAFTAGSGAIAFKTAFDEKLRRYAPGMLAQLDMIRAFHARPELQWMDSYTHRGNRMLDAVWKERRVVQRVAIGLDAWGEAALAALPLAQLAKRLLRKIPAFGRRARTSPSLQPA